MSRVVSSRIDSLHDVSRLNLLPRRAFAFINQRLIANVGRLIERNEELSGVIDHSNALVFDVDVVAEQNLNENASAEHQGHHEKPDQERLRLDRRLILSKSDHDCLTHELLLLSPRAASCLRHPDWRSARRCREAKAATLRNA